MPSAPPSGNQDIPSMPVTATPAMVASAPPLPSDEASVAPAPVTEQASVTSIVEESDPESFDDTPPAPSGPVDPKTIWPRLIDALMNDRPNLGTFLSMAYVASASGDSIDVRFPAHCSFQFAEATRKGNRETVLAKLAAIAGKSLALHMTIEKKKTDQQPAAPAAGIAPSPFSPSLQDDIENEPIIKNVLDIFDGEIV